GGRSEPGGLRWGWTGRIRLIPSRRRRPSPARRAAGRTRPSATPESKKREGDFSLPASCEAPRSPLLLLSLLRLLLAALLRLLGSLLFRLGGLLLGLRGGLGRRSLRGRCRSRLRPDRRLRGLGRAQRRRQRHRIPHA